MRVAVLVAVSVLAAACGSGTQPERGAAEAPGEISATRAALTTTTETDVSSESDEPPGCVSPSRFNGSHADGYSHTCELCRTVAPEQIASEYRLGSSDRIAIAANYAERAYPPELRRAARDGCLRGFDLR